MKNNPILEIKRESIPAVTRAQMIKVDRSMIDDYGITLLQMMENAGRNLASVAQFMLGGDLSGKRITVLCGGGNNGGGGMAASRHLINYGACVRAALAVSEEKLKEAPARQWQTLGRMGATRTLEYPIGDDDLIIDALIGYGLRDAPRGKMADWIDRANTSELSILSLDIPSGLDADSGEAPGACIRADATLTLALPKIGLLKKEATDYVGDLFLGDISVPHSLLEAMGMNPGRLFKSSPVVRIA